MRDAHSLIEQTGCQLRKCLGRVIPQAACYEARHYTLRSRTTSLARVSFEKKSVDSVPEVCSTPFPNTAAVQAV